MKLNALVVTTLALVVVSIVIGTVLYDGLPDPVPTHLDLQGRPNGFTAKPLGVFVAPAVLALLGFVFSVLPRISPRGFRLEPFLVTYQIVAIAVLALEFADGMMALSFAMGYELDVHRWVDMGTGLIMVVLGNFLGKVTRNFFVGIRTPWTLASSEVWLRTHRVGGVLFVLGGAIILISGIVRAGGGPFVVLTVGMVIALSVTVYSYVLYHRIEGGGSLHEEP
jgi:uncharacterized membrane protein